ncbi:hypothetical protein ACX1C1_10210 [Paenibacillus sp. strain BS8-2]
MGFRYLKRLLGLASMTVLLTLALSGTATAAAFEFTPTAKAAFDKMLAGAASSVSHSLKKQHADLQALQKQDAEWDTKISTLHYQNEEFENKLRKAIREIDAVKIKALEAASAALKKQNEPLFKLYESQRSQLSLARSLKNKELISFLNMQVEITKAAVQAAKNKQSSKDAALKQAKADASAKMKLIRDMLGAIETAESRIKTFKSTASTYKSLFTTESKVLGAAVRSGDTNTTAASFIRMIAYQRQMIVQKMNIHTYEGVIASTIAQADKKLRSF